MRQCVDSSIECCRSTSRDRQRARRRASASRRRAAAIVADAGVSDGTLSIAVVDDSTIHELNRQYLDHDYPTDVLSFVLEREAERLEGEIIVSLDTAARAAADYRLDGGRRTAAVRRFTARCTWSATMTTTDEARTAMRAAERSYLARVGLEVPRAAASVAKRCPA